MTKNYNKPDSYIKTQLETLCRWIYNLKGLELYIEKKYGCCNTVYLGDCIAGVTLFKKEVGYTPNLIVFKI